MVYVPEKVSSYMLLCALVQTYVFVLPDGEHLGFMGQNDGIASN